MSVLPRLRHRPRHATVVAYVALIVALGGTATAASSYVVSSNKQVAPRTIAGAAAPSGKHANLIKGSVGGSDLHADAVDGTKIDESTLGQVPSARHADVAAAADVAGVASRLGSPDPWHQVQPSPAESNRCATETGAFCNQSFEGDWYPSGNYGPPWETAGYFKDHEGVVHLKGLVTVGARTPFFILPPGYRPAANEMFTAVGSRYPSNDNDAEAVVGRIDVTPDGGVSLIFLCSSVQPSHCTALGTGYLSISGITFRAA